MPVESRQLVCDGDGWSRDSSGPTPLGDDAARPRTPVIVHVSAALAVVLAVVLPALVSVTVTEVRAAVVSSRVPEHGFRTHGVVVGIDKVRQALK